MFEINLLAASGGSAGGEIYFDWQYVAKHALNLGLLGLGLFYLLKKPVSQFLRSRREAMSARLDESQKKLKKAKELFDRSCEKLTSLKSDTDLLEREISEQTENERRKILLRARDEREAILKEVSRAFEFEAANAAREVRREAVFASMKIAEEKLKSAGDAERDADRSASIRMFAALSEEGSQWRR